MYRFPANYKEAMIHNFASRFGAPVKKIKKDEAEQRRIESVLGNGGNKANTKLTEKQ